MTQNWNWLFNDTQQWDPKKHEHRRDVTKIPKNVGHKHILRFFLNVNGKKLRNELNLS